MPESKGEEHRQLNPKQAKCRKKVSLQGFLIILSLKCFSIKQLTCTFGKSEAVQTIWTIPLFPEESHL